MNKFGNVVLAFVLVFAAAAAGCAKKEIIKPDVVEKAAVESTPVAAQETVKYDVKKGDSLWKIASGTEAYGNAFAWPLIFKANRDQMQDPDLIEANQQLNINKDFSQADTTEAVQNAKDTPAYMKHTAPRKTLPLKY